MAAKVALRPGLASWRGGDTGESGGEDCHSGHAQGKCRGPGAASMSAAVDGQARPGRPESEIGQGIESEAVQVAAADYLVSTGGEAAEAVES